MLLLSKISDDNISINSLRKCLQHFAFISVSLKKTKSVFISLLFPLLHQ